MTQNEMVMTGTLIVGVVLLIISIIKVDGKKNVSTTATTTSGNEPEKSEWLNTVWKSVWESDARIVFYTAVLLGVLNLMFKYMTQSVPELWQWYWNDNLHFALFFNIGWLVYAYFKSKRNEKGEPVPDAQSKAKVVMYAIGVLTVIAVAGSVRNNFETPANRQARQFMDKEVSRDSILRAICKVESGCQQFKKDGSVLIGEIDPDDRGIFQINRRIHKKLIEETKLDPDTYEGNVRLANILYDKYGTKPWDKSKHKWKKELEKMTPGLSKPFVLAIVDIPSDSWSEKVENPLIDNARIRWGWASPEGVGCKVMADEDPDKIFDVYETNNDIYPTSVQFMCEKPGAKMRVRIVPKL